MTGHRYDKDGNKLPKSLSDEDVQKILWWDDERKRGDSLLVTLKGYAFRSASDDPSYSGDSCEHVMGFDTATDAKEMIRSADKCVCKVCQE